MKQKRKQKMMQKIIPVMLCGAMVFSPAAAAAEEEDLIAGEVSAKVAVITMDKKYDYWIDMGQAAVDRAEEYNDAGSEIEVIWTAPVNDNIEEQVELINQAVSDGMDYLVVACIDADACSLALDRAVDAGVTLIYIDSPADVKAAATYATDNYEGGIELGEYLIEFLEEEGVTEGTISIVDAKFGNSACEDRYDGFVDAFAFTDFEIGDHEYSESDPEKAHSYAAAMINGGAIAIFGLDGDTTEGIVQAAAEEQEETGRKVYVVGWDSSDDTVDQIENGELLAFVAQNNTMMGREAIDAVVSMEKGEDLRGQVVNTGVTIYTAENIDDYK